MQLQSILSPFILRPLITLSYHLAPRTDQSRPRNSQSNSHSDNNVFSFPLNTALAPSALIPFLPILLQTHTPLRNCEKIRGRRNQISVAQTQISPKTRYEIEIVIQQYVKYKVG